VLGQVPVGLTFTPKSVRLPELPKFPHSNVFEAQNLIASEYTVLMINSQNPSSAMQLFFYFYRAQLQQNE